MIYRTALAIGLGLANVVLAIPYAAFPFDEQLPTVARVNQAYTFQINNETFLSSTGTVQYYAEDLPSWLSFDSGSRTLSGTPSEDDKTDSATFTLVGADDSGNYTSKCSLVVSDSTGPEASTKFTVLNQLADYGQTNGIDSVVLSPGEVFNITFDSKTFDSDDTIKAYYGRSSDRTPLPNWLFFDSSNLRFSGVAPPANSEIAPGFKYSFMFIATDYAGYAGNWVDFGITIGAHELTTTLKDAIHINGSAGDSLSYAIPLESVYEDGVAVTSSNITNAVLNGAPSWLSLNDFTLSGEVPDDYDQSDASTFNVTLYDSYSNSVTLFFFIESISSLFAVDSFKYSNATKGSYFQYYFLPSDFTDFENTNVTVEFGDDSDWLSFHESNLTINGETPDDFDETTVTVIASSKGTDDEMDFKIYGVDPINESSSSSRSHSSTKTSSHSATSTASATSSTSEPTATESDSSASSGHKKSSGVNKKALGIGLGVGLGGAALIIAALLIFCCCYKKRNNKDKDVESSSPNISGPILGNPANGPNGRSPVAGGIGAVGAAGYMTSPGSSSSSMTNDEKADWNEPQRLGALNVLKLDEKDYYEHDSGTSSTTNVASFDSIHDDESGDDTHSSVYQDALQAQSTDMLMGPPAETHVHTRHAGNSQPMTTAKKSWRQTIDSRFNRESLNSLATVSTNELFSVRLAEDDDIERDPRKSNLNFRDSAFLGSTASSILTRDDSGNIQKLDSDGNIVGHLNNSKDNLKGQRNSRATNLDILKEEDTPQPQAGKFEADTSFSSMNTGSSGEAFYPILTQGGDVQWKQQEKGAGFSFEKHQSNGLTQHTNDSKAKLRDFNNRIKSSQADISNDITQSTGETAEIESLSDH
ncbi:CYFA0S01e14994g1_1 [Cyberlindnera fabianii]|uniref:CYFA0S01e14994g1_1 n=1 Tax=Cyberlindnera fabianii TaxID=36022 RepID=A0A061AQP1_CYBFA|nr:CYFA0S01e14994g1_1 [Cyberlindnera fabianii]